MKLFKIYTECGCTRWIVAITRENAIAKYFEVVKKTKGDIKCEYICDRDEIIPTVEPIKEKIA